MEGAFGFVLGVFAWRAAGSGLPPARQPTRATPSVPEPPSETVRR